jgi:hypothetical protein
MEANKYTSDFQFIGNTIKKFNIKNNFLIYNDDDPNIKKYLDVSHKITEISLHEDEQKNQILFGLLNLDIKFNVSQNKYKTSISLLIEGCFNFPLEKTKKEFISRLNLNGVTTLYSIARTLILNITAQSYQSGKVILPMFNVVAYSKDCTELYNDEFEKLNIEESDESNINIITEKQ